MKLRITKETKIGGQVFYYLDQQIWFCLWINLLFSCNLEKVEKRRNEILAHPIKISEIIWTNENVFPFH